MPKRDDGNGLPAYIASSVHNSILLYRRIFFSTQQLYLFFSDKLLPASFTVYFDLPLSGFTIYWYDYGMIYMQH